MPEIEKVIKGLEVHEKGCGYRSHYCDDMECPYRYGDESCDIEEMCHDALVLLEKQKEEIENLKQTAQSMMEGIVVSTPMFYPCTSCQEFNCDFCKYKEIRRSVK